jgi:hypothetical protein
MLFFAILTRILGNKKKTRREEEEKKKRRRREENKKTKTPFLCHFDADSRKQGAKRRSDLRVVTELSDAADDEDAQNGKEKKVLRTLAP